jgi:peptide/nickel transport system permease protein
LNSLKKINSEIKWGGSILALYLVWAITWFIQSHFLKGSFSAPYLPSSDIKIELLGPGGQGFILGTDIYGRSLYELLSSGLNYSLGISLLVCLMAASIGIIVGYLSVTGPRFVKIASDLLINLIFVFPSILIAILIMAATGQSFWGLVFCLVVTGWPGYAKIVRGETIRVMGLTYVESAVAIGVSKLRLFFTILLPAIMPLLSVHIVLGLSGVIISEATLGFLGLGGSEYSWGSMLSMAKTVLLEAPSVVVFLSFSMGGLIIGLNLLGDGLRDYLDPKGV